MIETVYPIPLYRWHANVDMLLPSESSGTPNSVTIEKALTNGSRASHYSMFRAEMIDIP